LSTAAFVLLLGVLAAGLGYLVGTDDSGKHFVAATTGGVAGASTSRESVAPPKQQQNAATASKLPVRISARGEDLLAQRDLASFAGAYAHARSVAVRQVVGPGVFWVGRSATQEVLVHLQKGHRWWAPIRRGDRVSFVGVVARNPPAAAARWGIVASEGAPLLAKQGLHLEVLRSRVKIRRG
jgi:hypothetical protein